jgi:hypothetical protein
VRLVRTYVLWWIGLFWWWFALQGEWNRIEWVAAACMATVGAALGTAIAARGLLRFRPPFRAIADARGVPAQVVIDFAIVTGALARRIAGGSVEGSFVVRSFPSAGKGAPSAGDRGVRAVLATLSPNAYAVDLDPSSHSVLLHDLVVHRKSESPL